VTTSDNFRIKADHVVVATNSPVNNKFRIHLKQYPHRTYVIGAKVPKDTLPHVLWWDTGDHSLSNSIPPYHYVRVQELDKTHDLLICGGEDHPTGLTQDDRITEEDRYALLEIWMREKFDVQEIVYQWSGQVMEPMDSLAFIGRNPMDESNVYIVTGDSGNGLTHGTIAGILISDLINGRPNQWEKIYDPSRFKIFKSGKTFFSELVGGMLSYLKNKPKHLKTVELSDIKKEEGRIIELEGKRYGAFRDKNNTMHIVGAECSHLKCTVKWNNDEKTWDCPCHGSRFTFDGKTINGPANEDLPYHAENNFNL
jgi:nitrite reductase/ring-hydroxylating ferredoxin subunit